MFVVLNPINKNAWIHWEVLFEIQASDVYQAIRIAKKMGVVAPIVCPKEM